MTGFGNDEQRNLRESQEALTAAGFTELRPGEWGRQNPNLTKDLNIEYRAFDTGATRDTEAGKLDYEAFLSPLVLERFATYMDKHRTQNDGTLRDGDNWQKGMPKPVYMKSLWRHFMDAWKAHRGLPAQDLEESLCAIIFNTQGYLHELLRTDS